MRVKIHRRPLLPGEPDHELLWGSVIAAAMLMGAVWLRAGLPTPPCPLHALTGIPCPSCGTTRGFVALLHGDIRAAAAFNPLVMAGILAALFYTAYAAIAVLGRLPRWRVALSPKAGAMARIVLTGLLVSDWVYLLLHERLLAGIRPG